MTGAPGRGTAKRHPEVLLRPTLSADLHARHIYRVRPVEATDSITIIDVVTNIARNGLWDGYPVPNPIPGNPVDIIDRDPPIARLAGMSHRDAMAWVGNSIERTVLYQQIKGRKDGWSFHVIEATRGKAAAESWWKSRANHEIELRDGVQRPSRRRPRVASPDRLQLHP
jgi:hypothetical protein